MASRGISARVSRLILDVDFTVALLFRIGKNDRRENGFEVMFVMFNEYDR